MSLTALALAICVLLVTSGPTNTLLAIAGAERGFARALPLVLVGAMIVVQAPGLQLAITLIAGAWVLWLAVRQWQMPAPARGGQSATARRPGGPGDIAAPPGGPGRHPIIGPNLPPVSV